MIRSSNCMFLSRRRTSALPAIWTASSISERGFPILVKATMIMLDRGLRSAWRSVSFDYPSLFDGILDVLHQFFGVCVAPVKMIRRSMTTASEMMEHKRMGT